MTTLTDAPLAQLLDRMFAEAEAPASPELTAALGRVASEERSRAEREHGRGRLPQVLRPRQGRLPGRLPRHRPAALHARALHRRQLDRRVRHIIRHIHLHLAAALRDTGGGRIITTEFEPSKAARAQQNFAAAQLDDLIELREGDAVKTLANDLPGQIDLVLLDGAKGLYPAILTLLEEHLRPGALIVADNADRSPEYLAHVRSTACGYTSVPFTDDVELSMRT